MKKRLKFFFLGFFSHKRSKEGTRYGYSSVFWSFLLALALLWTGFFCGDTLSFGVYYGNSPDFQGTVRALLANPDESLRIFAEIENGDLKAKKQDGEYEDALLVNTLENEEDEKNYSIDGFNAVVDMRPADTLAQIEAYCVSNDGKGTVISYEDYLTLSEVARLNFDFKIRYTGNALELDGGAVAEYLTYLNGLTDEVKSEVDSLASELAEGRITQEEYDRGVYELYFVNYYPEISEYETTSKVPLLRNYYYHQYVSQGLENFIFIFDDYMTGMFENEAGAQVSFYGFYSGIENGAVVPNGEKQGRANELADGFTKASFGTTGFLNAYGYALNVISLAPFLALMLLVAALLAYSILRLKGVDSVTTLGAALKIVGSYSWFSAAVACVLTFALSFAVGRGKLGALPVIAFFVTLAARSIIFTFKEAKQAKAKTEEETEA